MDKDHDNRFSRLEDNVDNIARLIVNNHNDVIQRLSKMETKQDVFKEYQTSCEDDRKNLDGRVNNLERSESRQSGKSSALNLVVSIMISGIIAIIAALLGRTR